MLLEFDFNAWLVGLAVLGLVLIGLGWRSRFTLFRLFGAALFGVYVLVVISLTLFPMPLPDNNPIEPVLQQIQQMQHVHALNLLPLNFDSCWEFPRSCFTNLFGNILLTVPFGFGFGFLFRPRFREFFWWGFGPGLAIEGLQFVFNLVTGGAYRTVDINDVLLNALGAWVGFGLWWLWVELVRYFVNSRLGLKE
ncbi:MAG: VanZ family protein [Chloroflexota bacterium]